MAAPSQGTAAVGNKITASLWNDDVRDAVNWIIGGASGRRASFRAHMAAAQSIPNTTVTVVKYDTVDEDTDGMYSASTGLCTCVTAGLYYVSGCGTFANNATGIRQFFVQSSGWPAVLSSPIVSAATDGNGTCQVDGLVRVTAGQTFNIASRQTSGGALNTGTGLGSGSGGAVVFTATLVSL